MKTNTKLQKFTNILSNLFLLCLGLLAFQSIFGQSIFGFDLANYEYGKLFLGFIEKIQYTLVILAIVSGALLISKNKNNLNTIFYEEKKPSKSKNLLFYLGIIIIFLISLFLFSINIGTLSFEDDEFFTVSVAKNLHETGELYQWDFIENIPGQISETCAKKDYCHYTRSYLYTYAVELSYKIFGISEFSTRLPGVIFYFLSMLLLIVFFKKIKFKNSFILLTLLLFLGSNIIFNNFFTARMYSFLIFSVLLTYILIVLIYKNIKENKRKSAYINSILLLLTMFLGYNSHINYLLFIAIIILYFLIINISLIKKYLTNFKKNTSNIKYIYLILIIIIGVFLFYELNIYKRVQNFITFRESPGYYLRYFYYIFSSSLGKLGNHNILLLFSGLSFFIFFKNLKNIKNMIFYIPYFIVFLSVILYIYLLDTKFFISYRYISHINIFAVIMITMTIFILGNSFNKSYKKYFISLIIIISSFGIFNLVLGEQNKKNIFANYNLGYNKLLNNFDRQSDILIGIPIRDYYISGLGNIIKINASQRFNNYNFIKFKEDLMRYKNKNIYFIYSDIKSFHVNKKIKKYLKENIQVFSHDGNITIYKIPKEKIIVE